MYWRVMGVNNRWCPTHLMTKAVLGGEREKGPARGVSLPFDCEHHWGKSEEGMGVHGRWEVQRLPLGCRPAFLRASCRELNLAEKEPSVSEPVDGRVLPPSQLKEINTSF